MTNKITYKSVLEKVIAGKPLTADEIEKAQALLASLEKKSGTERKPTATQVANEGLSAAIFEVMTAEPNRLFTVSELLKAVPAVAGMSNQKVSALLRGMKDKGMVEKVEDKRKSFFRAIVTE